MLTKKIFLLREANKFRASIVCGIAAWPSFVSLHYNWKDFAIKKSMKRILTTTPVRSKKNVEYLSMISFMEEIFLLRAVFINFPIALRYFFYV